MTRTVIADGIIRLTGENGILDTRDGKVYEIKPGELLKIG